MVQHDGGSHIKPRRVRRVTPGLLREVVRRIVRAVDPDKIILFGSYAYGQPHESSDVDLLVIMRTKQRPVEQAYAIRRTVEFPFPVDLLVRTPEQMEERLRMGDCFIREIVSRGKVLYEAHRE